MFQTVLQSADLPPGERLARFDEATGSQVTAGGIPSDPERLHFTLRGADLAGVNVEELGVANSLFHRGARVVRPCGPDLYGVMVMRSGGFTVSQGGRAADLSGGDFALYDSSQPLEVQFDEKDDRPLTLHLMRLLVPRALMSLPASKVSRLTGTRLSGSQGIGGLLTQFLASLTADTGSYRPVDAARLGTVVTDLLTAALAQHLDDPATVPDDSRRTALLTGVQAFIQRHLDDPDLSPRSIAAAHHVSVSYLHRLFADDGATVAAWVRDQRLERARRDLADPALREMPVHRIAARWGFSDHATFTRAFRGAYHLPPQAYREKALSQV